jgi:hypothetical protein
MQARKLSRGIPAILHINSLCVIGVRYAILAHQDLFHMTASGAQTMFIFKKWLGLPGTY